MDAIDHHVSALLDRLDPAGGPCTVAGASTIRRVPAPTGSSSPIGRTAVAIDTGIATSAELSANLVALLPVRNAIADALDGMGWEHDEALRVLVSAVEGLVNAVEYGRRQADE